MIAFSLPGPLVDGGDKFLALFTLARAVCAAMARPSPDPKSERDLGKRTGRKKH